MKTILTIRDQDILPDAPVLDKIDFRKREAARAIVSDSDGKIALLRVGKHNYHKLPGGGVDDGEDIPTALRRELLEEIGCTAEVNNEVGQVIEYRDQFKLFQTSYCFTATQTGEKGLPDFTESELAEGFSIVWVDDLESAINLLENDSPNNYDGAFIQVRDLALLKAALQQS